MGAGNTSLLETAGGANVTTTSELSGNASIEVIPNCIVDIPKHACSARVHCVVLKALSNKAVCILIMLDAYMGGHPGEVDCGTGGLKGTDGSQALINKITISKGGDKLI